MQISTYLRVPLSAVLAWQCTQPFLCKAMKISSILGLLDNFLEAVVKDQMGSSLNRPWSGEPSLSIGRAGVGKKKMSSSKVFRNCNTRLFFFFLLLRGFKAWSWPLQRPLVTFTENQPIDITAENINSTTKAHCTTWTA